MIKIDLRDFYFHEEVGSTNVFTDESNFGDSVPHLVENPGEVDCTAISTDKVYYSQKGSFYDLQTLWTATPHTTTGADPRQTLATAIKLGMFAAYFRADTGSMAAHDNVRSAMTLAESSCQVNSNWYSNWTDVQPGGVMPQGDTAVSEHSYTILDWKLVNGVPMFLIDADFGYTTYMPFDVFDTEMTRLGTTAFMPCNETVQNLHDIPVYESILKILNTILNLLVSNKPMQQTTPVISSQPQAPQAEVLVWDTATNCEHAVRVTCDNQGLTPEEKDIIQACVHQESDFMNYHPDGTPVKNINLNKDGSLSSTDWGIVEINDYFHIGPGKDFPSVDFVMANPQKCVEFMISMYKEGKLGLWSSYKSGAYRKYLLL